jgi:hypothetical protein
MTSSTHLKAASRDDNVWSALVEQLLPIQANLNSATTPLAPFRRKRLPLKKIIKEYFYILAGLPDKEFELAIRDLYWAAVIDQSRSKSGCSRTNASGALLFEADLSKLTLDGINLKQASLCYATLIATSLREANISRGQLQGVRLNGGKLESADLSGASFQDADLSRASLRHANLSGADFRGAKLREADLRKALCVGADFSFADLSKADLGGADISDVFSNALTIWPTRLSRPAPAESAVDGPASASMGQITSFLQQALGNQVPMVSQVDIAKVTSFVLKKIIDAETKFSLDRDAVVRFIRKPELDRLVHFDPRVKRYVRYIASDVSAEQGRHMVNVVAREVSSYNILVIPKNRRPPLTKRRGKTHPIESSQW